MVLRLRVCLALSLICNAVHAAYQEASSSSVVLYWGQAGGTFSTGLAETCQSTSVDIVILSFLTGFASSSGLPILNFANSCNDKFPNSDLAQCDQIAQDIAFCQAQGIKILLSMGGATGSITFSSAGQATSSADTLWNVFGEGNAEQRPFGPAVLDGFDLDIESGSSEFYTDFVTQLRHRFSESSEKTYYITAAPQCVYPDAHLYEVLDTAFIDMVFIQFYNNPCSIDGSFNFNQWNDWAKTAPNANIKLYLGVPAAAAAAGSGFVSPSELASTALSIKSTYQSFGGVMMWDASFINLQSDSNVCRIIKESLETNDSTNSVAVASSLIAGPSIEVLSANQPIQTSTTSESQAQTRTVAVQATLSTSSSDENSDEPCDTEGAMQCMGGGFGTCDHGAWVIRSCASGTTCRPFEGSILCDFTPVARRRGKRSHVHRIRK